MANSKKRRKAWVFSGIALAIVAFSGVAMFKKRDVIISVQTEKVTRHNLTEIVNANGKIQPVIQVKISPEVSGEIIELPVKEGQLVKKGDLLVKIKPDFYVAAKNQAEAGYKSSVAGKSTAEATLRKADAEYKRGLDLAKHKLISESAFDELKAAHDVAEAQLVSAEDQVDMSRANLDSAEEQLAKTTIASPLTGTISKLNSQLGERVLGTVQNAGTEIMTIADLNDMEARIDIGEVDVVLIKPGQLVRLEVDAFKDRKFTGVVTEIANSSTSSGLANSGFNSGNSQEATRFGVKIGINEKEAFRPGMSCTAEIETRYATNVLCVPIAAVTTRSPKEKGDGSTNGVAKAKGTNPPATQTNLVVSATNNPADTNWGRSEKKAKDNLKVLEVVFLADGDHAKMIPVKRGISDDNYYEIVEGVQEGTEVVSGGYKAIHDLEDGKKIKKGGPGVAMAGSPTEKPAE